jgi:hypothetical protein
VRGGRVEGVFLGGDGTFDKREKAITRETDEVKIPFFWRMGLDE